MNKQRLIDTNALLDKFRYSERQTEDDKTWIMTIRRMIKEAPTIDPVRHGKWESYDGVIRVNCSNCKEVYLSSTILEITKCNYCPNCGARMDDK